MGRTANGSNVLRPAKGRLVMTNSTIERSAEMVRDVSIPIDGRSLAGDLIVPAGAKGVVLFAHGSGSSRQSVRNRLVAERMRQAGLATLLFDLLTPEEDLIDARTRQLRFDIRLLATRLDAATNAVSKWPETADLRVGYFGSSTGAAAAIVAAAEGRGRVCAIVSRGGRPDLAGSYLPRVTAPTLLIVGGWDIPVFGLNEEASGLMRCERKLVVVPRATHLFEEPGKLEEVAELAAAWFVGHLTRNAVPRPSEMASRC